MPRRQLAVFRLGCYLAILAAAVHLVGLVLGPPAPANDTERQIKELTTAYRFSMLGGATRTMRDFMDGFSLAFSALVAALGGIGLIVARRGSADAILMAGVARVLAGVSAVMLVISFTHFFIVPTMMITTFAVCFAMASVRPPAE